MKAIIQLHNTDGEAIALFTYDTDRYTEDEAISVIEDVFEEANIGDSEEDEEEEYDIMDAAEQMLSERGIDRVLAGEAYTNTL
jgi:hypothetical protein